MNTNIGVFLGGRSVEHEISILSALQAINAVDRKRFDVVPVYISKEGPWYTGPALLDIENYKDLDALKKNSVQVIPVQKDGRLMLQRNPPSRFKDNQIAWIDVALPVTHGTFGEDGCLQGLFELYGLPYVGCDVTASALGMDKVRFKQIAQQHDLPVLDSIHFRCKQWFTDPKPYQDEIMQTIGFPAIVKPVNLGSSIGVNVVNDAAELEEAIQLAGRFCDSIIVEKLVENLMEINCSVLGDADEVMSSVCEEPLRSSDFLSFEDKYQSKSGGSKGMQSSQRRIPADISEDMSKNIQELARETFLAIGAAGVARVDFLIDRKTEQVYVNEINTIPGSLSFYLWESQGIHFSDLLDRLINIALKRSREKSKLIYSHATNILSLSAKSGSKF